MSDVHRMRNVCALTNPCDGVPAWSPAKSLWYTAMATVAVVGGWFTFQWDAAVVACLLTITTLCLGHSVGLHRLLIHRSFECPLWLEYCLVYLGILVGMGGPRRMVFLHDIRDWSQRHPECHRFFIHQSPIWLDWFWQDALRIATEICARFRAGRTNHRTAILPGVGQNVDAAAAATCVVSLLFWWNAVGRLGNLCTGDVIVDWPTGWSATSLTTSARNPG